MRINRIYLDMPLQSGQRIELPRAAAHHVSRVLRMRAGQTVQIFNGSGGSYLAEISAIAGRQVELTALSFDARDHESRLHITLVQAVSRQRHMDYTIQKAVELGVTRIVPVLTGYGNVDLSGDRIDKRMQHWQGIVISACEQCGRNLVPELAAPLPLTDWLNREETGLKLALLPDADRFLPDQDPRSGSVCLLSGPEGGLSEGEATLVLQSGYSAVNLGPRILRTETAAVAAISVCQALWGDLRGS